MSLSKKAVLITGASSGIGKCCVYKLSEAGFDVYAAVRTKEAERELLSIDSARINPLILDITEPQSIEAAKQQLRKVDLFALVNNAGSAVLGPLEFIPLEDIRNQFEVNLFGHIALTQSFLPKLRQTKGRIINMSSISGFVGFPFFGPYCSSKFAFEGFSESLSRELKSQGISVSIIEPGNINTGIWESSFNTGQNIEEKFPTEAHQIYGRRFAGKNRNSYGPSVKSEPEDVAKVVVHVLNTDRPKQRYLVGKDAKKIAMMKRLLGSQLFDRWLS